MNGKQRRLSRIFNKSTGRSLVIAVDHGMALGAMSGIVNIRKTIDDLDATGLVDVWTGKPLPYEKLPGWDDSSIYTTNALLLPALIGRKLHFDHQRIVADLTNGIRETLTPYGCGHTSSQPQYIRISQNLWRDHTGRYLGAVVPPIEGRYWDLQLYSNTHGQSFGFMDFYITNESCFYSRGAVTFGYFLAGPRIQIDRLAEGQHVGGLAVAVGPEQVAGGLDALVVWGAHHHGALQLAPIAVDIRPGTRHQYVSLPYGPVDVDAVGDGRLPAHLAPEPR